MNNLSGKDHLETTVVQFIRQLQGDEHSCQQENENYLRLLQTEKLSGLGLVASTLAHDITNPLTAIIGEAQMLAMFHADNPEVVGSCKIIEQQGKHIAHLVRSICAYARQSGEDWQAIFLHEVIDEALMLVSKFLATNSIVVTKRYCPEDPLIVGNPNQLEQVFINLFQNAVQAMVDGGTLTIDTQVLVDTVTVSVTDTGTGIPSEYIPRIFDAFFTTKPVGQGTGLGLAICKRIVEDHHGTIVVESWAGQGTRMIITLPVSL